MKNFTNENWINSEYKQSCFLDDSSFIDLNILCNTVIDTANQVYANLRPGLPKSVYQLMLLNYLVNKGLQLETETSVLARCVDNEFARDIIIVNGVLVIECIVEDEITNHSQKRTMFDIQNNGHAMGLLINFGENIQNKRILKLYQDTVSH